MWIQGSRRKRWSNLGKDNYIIAHKDRLDRATISVEETTSNRRDAVGIHHRGTEGRVDTDRRHRDFSAQRHEGDYSAAAMRWVARMCGAGGFWRGGREVLLP